MCFLPPNAGAGGDAACIKPHGYHSYDEESESGLATLRAVSSWCLVTEGDEAVKCEEVFATLLRFMLTVLSVGASFQFGTMILISKNVRCVLSVGRTLN